MSVIISITADNAVDAAAALEVLANRGLETQALVNQVKRYADQAAASAAKADTAARNAEMAAQEVKKA